MAELPACAGGATLTTPASTDNTLIRGSPARPDPSRTSSAARYIGRMSERLQFNLRHVLLATTELAVCFALLASHNQIEQALPRNYAMLAGYYGLIVGLPAAAV